MRISDTGAAFAAERHICAFPGVLGTGMIITSEKGIPQDAQDSLRRSISGYEAALSRFLPYSLVRAMGDPQGIAEHNGIFEFPEYCRPLFDIYDSLYEATDGRIDPCIGESLIQLGYSVPFDLIGNGPASSGPVGTAPGRPRSISAGATPAGFYTAGWRSIRREGATLYTGTPVSLDFGAAGKGFCVDLLSAQLEALGCGAFTIDAGGDLYFSAALVFFVVITAASSSLNSLLFSAGRHLYQVANESRQGSVLRFFSLEQVSGHKVPARAILMSGLFILLSPAVSLFPAVTQAFTWFSSASSAVIIGIYILTVIAHWKYRRSADFSADGFLMPAYKIFDALAIAFFILIYISLFMAADTVWLAVGGLVWFTVFGVWSHFRVRRMQERHTASL